MPHIKIEYKLYYKQMYRSTIYRDKLHYANGTHYLIREWTGPDKAKKQWIADMGYKFNHPNIVPYTSITSKPKPNTYIYEHHGEYLHNIRNRDCISDETLLKLIIDIGNGLAHMHTCGLICNNIHDKNILVNVKNGVATASIYAYISFLLNSIIYNESPPREVFLYDITADTVHFARLIIHLCTKKPSFEWLTQMCTVTLSSIYTNRLTIFEFLHAIRVCVPHYSHYIAMYIPPPVPGSLTCCSSPVGPLYFHNAIYSTGIRLWGKGPLGVKVQIHVTFSSTNNVNYFVKREKTFQMSDTVELLLEVYKPLGEFVFNADTVTGNVRVIIGDSCDKIYNI